MRAMLRAGAYRRHIENSIRAGNTTWPFMGGRRPGVAAGLTDGVRRTTVVHLLNRKRFVNTLGVAGLGLGLLAGAAGAPFVMAQENPSPGIDRPIFQHEAGA